MKRLSLVAACGFALSASALHAQLFWYPQEGSNIWQNGGAANWRPNTDGSGTPTAWANSPLAEATFNSSASTVSVSGQVETSYLTIATAGYTFNGGTILINSGTSNNAFRSTATTGSLTINSALDFRRTSSGLVNVNSAGTDVTFAAVNGVTANNIANIDFNQAGETSRMDFNGTITATVMRFGISGNGGASYYLNTANAIATRSEVARGTVYVSHNDALGGGTRGLQLGNNDSGTNTVALLINGAYSLSNPITLSGREGTTNKRILGGSTANESSFTGNIALSRTSPVRVNNLEVTAALGGRVDFSGVISGTNNGATDLAYVTKSGLGTVRFTNAAGNTYEGGTTISAGVLLAMNTDSATSATGTGAVTVEDGGTLGGTGYVSGLVSTTGVAGTGRFAPGDANAIGRLNLQGGLTVANGAIFDIQLNGSSSDQINFGSGNLSLDGDIVFNLSTTLGGTVLTGNPYTIFLTTSGTPGSWILGGNLAFLFNAPSGYALDGSYGSGGYLWDATSRSLSVQLVPEPSTWLLLSAAGMALVLMRRRRCAH